MTAHDLLDILPAPPQPNFRDADAAVPVDADISRVLAAFASPGVGRLAVVNDADVRGFIDEKDFMQWLSASLLPPREDSSWIVAECVPADYSASRIAHAVEDADAHLLNLSAAPSPGGRTRVFLRVSLSDPSPAVRSLERYGYEVVDYRSPDGSRDPVLSRRLDELSLYLNI